WARISNRDRIVLPIFHRVFHLLGHICRSEICSRWNFADRLLSGGEQLDVGSTYVDGENMMMFLVRARVIRGERVGDRFLAGHGDIHSDYRNKVAFAKLPHRDRKPQKHLNAVPFRPAAITYEHNSLPQGRQLGNTLWVEDAT